MHCITDASEITKCIWFNKSANCRSWVPLSDFPRPIIINGRRNANLLNTLFEESSQIRQPEGISKQQVASEPKYTQDLQICTFRI